MAHVRDVIVTLCDLNGGRNTTDSGGSFIRPRIKFFVRHHKLCILNSGGEKWMRIPSLAFKNHFLLYNDSVRPCMSFGILPLILQCVSMSRMALSDGWQERGTDEIFINFYILLINTYKTADTLEDHCESSRSHNPYLTIVHPPNNSTIKGRRRKCLIGGFDTQSSTIYVKVPLKRRRKYKKLVLPKIYYRMAKVLVRKRLIKWSAS